MPNGHKICLLGLGSVKSYIHAAITAGAYSHNIIEPVKVPSGNLNIANPYKSGKMDFEITPDFNIVKKEHFKSLCDIYKSVQRKYYPEKDVYKKGI